MFPLGVISRRATDNWTTASSHTFTEVEGVNKSVLLTSSLATGGSWEDWLVSNEKHQFNKGSISFKFPVSNYLSSNYFNNGATFYIKAMCYDSGNTFLGYVGFAYIFAATGTVNYGVYVVRDVGGFSSSEVSGSLGVASYNASDEFTLLSDPTTYQWKMYKNGGNQVDGHSILGDIPHTTAYIKYQIVLNVGADIVGVGAVNVTSIA